MNKREYLTAESVTIGHPDKLADEIADGILTECIKQDRNSRVACEVMLTNGKCYISGEITTRANVDYISVAKGVIKDVGYETKNVKFVCQIHEQSPDIKVAVDKTDKKEMGAGDQGIVYGYATNETPEMLPLPFVTARKITSELHSYIKSFEKNNDDDKKQICPIKPDGKALVSVVRDKNGIHLKNIVVSVQHVHLETDEEKVEFRRLIADAIIKKALYGKGVRPLLDEDFKIMINPSGNFEVGGFEADTGLTGRKLMVDTYGGLAHHGGGAFSGKDATKVDRSGAYLARYIAKNIVAARLCERCEISIAYAIGRAEPIAYNIDTFGTGVVSDEILRKAVSKVFDPRPQAIIQQFDLTSVDYLKVAFRGHFGNDEFPWEKTDKAEMLRIMVKNEI